MKVQSIDRVFDILELLSIEPEGLKLTEISVTLNLPTSTVHRLTSDLCSRNYVEKNEETNRYRLGLGLVELTSSFLSSLELKTEARPLLRQLSKESGQVVFMAIEQEGEVVYIDRFERFNNRRNHCIIGSRMPMYCTALGKALLMEFKDSDIQKLYGTKELTPLTEHTITDIDTLIKEIRLNRSRGYSEDNEENTFGRNCVAAPIYDYNRNIIAAISTTWEIESEDSSAKTRSIDLICKTSREISIRMGWVAN